LIEEALRFKITPKKLEKLEREAFSLYQEKSEEEKIIQTLNQVRINFFEQKKKKNFFFTFIRLRKNLNFYMLLRHFVDCTRKLMQRIEN